MYETFLTVMQSFKYGVLDTNGMVVWLSTLFAGSAELLQEFTFLSRNFKIECGTVDNRYAFRVFNGSTAYIRIPDLKAMENLILSSVPWENEHLYIEQLQWIDPASLNILRPSSRIVAPLGWTTEQPVSRVSEVIEARQTLPRRLKAVLARLKPKT